MEQFNKLSRDIYLGNFHEFLKYWVGEFYMKQEELCPQEGEFEDGDFPYGKLKQAAAKEMAKILASHHDGPTRLAFK